MVDAIVHQADPKVTVRSVHASKSKVCRAEPVAALYEQGRVLHAPDLHKVEAQMCQMTFAGYMGQGSPDRVDALVWALHELMLGPRAMGAAPRVRSV